MQASNEEAVKAFLMEQYRIKKRDFLFKSNSVAKKLDISSYAVRDVLKKMEADERIEKTDLSSTVTLWRTRFEKTKGKW